MIELLPRGELAGDSKDVVAKLTLLLVLVLLWGPDGCKEKGTFVALVGCCDFT